jgi:hypothetical protein
VMFRFIDILRYPTPDSAGYRPILRYPTPDTGPRRNGPERTVKLPNIAESGHWISADTADTAAAKTRYPAPPYRGAGPDTAPGYHLEAKTRRND